MCNAADGYDNGSLNVGTSKDINPSSWCMKQFYSNSPVAKPNEFLLFSEPDCKGEGLSFRINLATFRTSVNIPVKLIDNDKGGDY